MGNTTKGRVIIPRNPKDLLDLAANVYKKHTDDGKTSELNNLDGYDWSVVGSTIPDAQKYHKQAETLRGQMEEQYRLRDALLKPINEITKASSGYLKGKYRKNPKKLADWGYSVDDTPRVKKEKKPMEGKK